MGHHGPLPVVTAPVDDSACKDARGEWGTDVTLDTNDPVAFFNIPSMAPPDIFSAEVVTAKQRLLQAACIFFNVLCGLTNGYDICVTSVVLGHMVEDFSLCGAGGGTGSAAFGVNSCPGKQAVMSLSAVGSLCSKLLLAWLADRFGRRPTLALVDCAIILAVALQCLAGSAAVLLLGRFVLGVGIGLAFVVEPTYVCEIAPADCRGRFVVLNEVAVCVGCLLGLQVSTALLRPGGPGAWRTAVGLGALPACVQLLFLGVLPESPRWLAVQRNEKELLHAALRLGLPSKELHGLLELAADSAPPASVEASACSLGYLRGLQARAWSLYKTSFLMALCFAFFNTASGIYAMQAYADDILRYCGVTEPHGLLPFVGWVKLVGSLVAIGSADLACAGRRRLALLGGTFCMVSDLVLAWRLGLPRTLPPFMGALFFFVFIFSWNIGYGSLQFVATLELLPNDVRSFWAGQIFAAVGVAEIMIYQLFETCLLSDGVFTFLGFAAINGLAALFAGCVMSDLRGRSLEEAAGSLADPGFLGPSAGRDADQAPDRGQPMAVGHRAPGVSRRYSILVEERPIGAPSKSSIVPGGPRAGPLQPEVVGAPTADGI